MEHQAGVLKCVNHNGVREVENLHNHVAVYVPKDEKGMAISGPCLCMALTVDHFSQKCT